MKRWTSRQAKTIQTFLTHRSKVTMCGIFVDCVKIHDLLSASFSIPGSVPIIPTGGAKVKKFKSHTQLLLQWNITKRKKGSFFFRNSHISDSCWALWQKPGSFRIVIHWYTDSCVNGYGWKALTLMLTTMHIWLTAMLTAWQCVSGNFKKFCA